MCALQSGGHKAKLEQINFICDTYVYPEEIFFSLTREGSVAKILAGRESSSAGHSYPANAANWAKPLLTRSNCFFWIICSTSMLSSVAVAEAELSEQHVAQTHSLQASPKVCKKARTKICA